MRRPSATVVSAVRMISSGATSKTAAFSAAIRAQYGLVFGIARYIAYAIAKRLYFGPQLYIAAFWVDPTLPTSTSLTKSGVALSRARANAGTSG